METNVEHRTSNAERRSEAAVFAMNQTSAIAERICVIIPAYREGGCIGAVVVAVRRHIEPVVVVDDGSPDATSAEAEKAGAVVIRHERNQGKAAALKKGFDYASRNGFAGVIVMDGDGQHDPEDLPRFLEARRRTGYPVLIGNRMADCVTMPWIRRWTNRFTSWVLSREMQGQTVPDSQCGYRFYQTDVLPKAETESKDFAAESEILLRLADEGIKIGVVPIRTIYGDERSKIRPWRDATQFFGVVIRHRRGRRQKRQAGGKLPS